jgi:hypothetical protein
MANRKKGTGPAGSATGNPRKLSDRKRNRQVRMSQTVVPFGVGNIYDYLGESFVACDTSYWKQHGDELVAPRLAQALRVRGFRSAPVQPDSPWSSRGPAVPYYRFPEWLFCQTCRRMIRWSPRMEQTGEPARCSNCEGRPQLVPMRFVLACEAGHLGDVPWDRWTHANHGGNEDQRRCENPKLRFRTVIGVGSGLGSLEMRCDTCHARNTLKGITQSNSLKRIGVKCPGKQPWERDRRECDLVPQVLQRGASNLYYGTQVSAIDIPPHSNYSSFSDLTLRVTGTSLFRTLMSLPDLPFKDDLIQVLAQEVACKPDEVRAILRREAQESVDLASRAIEDSIDLETEEWQAFVTPQQDQDERDGFITRHTTFLPAGHRELLPHSIQLLDKLVGEVVLVTRLREVRALSHFSRLLPEKVKLSPNLDHGGDWLPAIEVFGEGIFLSLAEGKVRAWENNAFIRSAAAELEGRRVASLFGARLKTATPRFLLLHTLAHLMIRQLTFQCGYSSSSIRERIYAKSPERGEAQAGILLYTAAGDVEGTLGGLVRQGEPPRLYQTLLTALERGSWCSSDPICREARAQGFEGLNRGACHACSLVAETSCDYANALLDRSFLIGGSGEVTGFFEDVLAAAGVDSLQARGLP